MLSFRAYETVSTLVMYTIAGIFIIVILLLLVSLMR